MDLHPSFVLSNLHRNNLLTQRRSSPSYSHRCSRHPIASANKTLYHKSPTKIIKLTGNDRLSFLHNQSTNAFIDRKPGEAIDTTFTLPTGRVIDFGTVLIRNDDVLLLVSQETIEELVERFDRFIFPTDEVEIQNASSDYQVRNVYFVGGGSGSGDTDLVVGDDGEVFYKGMNWKRGEFVVGDKEGVVLYLGGSGLSLPGFRVVEDVGGGLQENDGLFGRDGFCEIGDEEYERLRIRDGRPNVKKDLDRKWIALEAGLWHTVSFEKGCYVGQETIAKLNTRDGVNNWIIGLDSAQVLKEGATITDGEGKKVGEVTSSIDDEDGRGLSLGYVKRKKGFGVPGKKVLVDGIDAVTRDIPFATRSAEECADVKVGVK